MPVGARDSPGDFPCCRFLHGDIVQTAAMAESWSAEGNGMALEFTVLASGSSGNASLVRTNGFGLLLDIGLGPRDLAGRLAAIGAAWRNVHAVLLTHTHSDHWNERTLAYLRRFRTTLSHRARRPAAIRESVRGLWGRRPDVQASAATTRG